MLSWLIRKRPTKEQLSSTGYVAPARSQDLLNTSRRQQLLENIWHRASMSRQQFKLLYQGPLER
ncbi:TraI domain-containing protein [Pseudomonas capeferrum]|uniref:TraI domain-containing protein n=1 Tax=Pseudomonas capeferrum TaxID=1495066 RepID=UPI001C616B42|nr:TraI domain-containing protein [Pseudomonas capeferrum]